MRDQSIPKPLRCAIYVRVSSKGQEEEGTSLDSQEERCRAYAKEHGWEVAGIFRETHTGAQLWERPRLTEVRDMIRDGAIDVLLCYALDRLSRKQTHVAIVAEEIDRAGATLAFVTEDFEKSAVGTFLRSAKAFAAELEREKIAERTGRGRRARAQQGKLLPGCRCLFGYTWANDEHSALTPNPDTAPIVRGIFHAILSGGTLYSVAAGLTRDRVPTPTGKDRWGISTVRTILCHPHYMGVAAALRDWHNGSLAGEENAVALPDGTVPPIVSPEEWNGTQIILQRNKARAPRNNRKPEAFLLRGGFVRCGHCGSTMPVGTVRRKGEGEYVYRCGRGSRPGNGCTHHGIRTHLLDAAVWERVRVIFTDPAVIARELETLRRDNPTKHDLTAVERSLAEVVRQQENLSRSLAALDDPDAAAPVIGQLKALGQRKKELEAERKMVAERGREWEMTRANLDDLTAWCGTVGSNLDSLTYMEKRAALDALGIGVTLYRADHAPRYVIEANIPLGREIVNTTSASSDRTSTLP